MREYQRMQTDAQLKGLLLATMLPIRRMRFELDPNEASPTVYGHVSQSTGLPIIDEDMAPRIRRRKFDFAGHLAHALQAVAYGHYPFEEVYDYDDPREGGDGLLHLRKLGSRPPRTIANIAMNNEGELDGIQQNLWTRNQQVKSRTAAFGGGLYGELIPADRLVYYCWDSEDDGDWIGKSLLRPCFKNWLIKDALIRVDATKHQRNAMGVPWFEVDPAASEEQIANLAKIAQEWRAGADAGGAGPGKPHLKGVDGTLPDTIASVRYHDQQMSRAFLLLFYDLGTTQTGSRALGGDFIDWYADAQDAIADWFCKSFQKQIEREVELNWGPDEQPPLLTYQRSEATEMSLQDLATAAEAGLIELDPELGEYVARRWHLPKSAGQIEPKPAEGSAPTAPAKEVPITQQEAPPAGGANRPQREDMAARLVAAIDRPMAWASAARAAGTESRNGTARRARDSLVAAGVISRARDGTVAPVAGLQLPDRELRRQPLEFEVAAKVDFAAMEETFLAERDSLVAAVASAQGAQVDELAAAVEAAAGDAVTLAKLTVAPVDAAMIETHLARTASAGVSSARTEHDAQEGANAAARPRAAATEPDQGRIDKTIEERAEAVSLTLAGGLATAASKRAAQVSTLPAAEAASNVRDYLDGLSNAALEEQLGGATMQAYNTGRREYMRASEPSRVYASEILDANTCDACATEDGTEWSSVTEAEGDYPLGGFVECEGGLRCRGTLVATY